MSQIAHLQLVQSRIAPYIHRTPVLHSSGLDGLSGSELWFKCENFQRMGAFKMRGACNALLELTAPQRKQGVVCHSSGNFAQAVSLAARELGVKAYVVMPENATTNKVKAVKAYGGEIRFSGNSIAERAAFAEAVIRETGAAFIHPSDHLSVIEGNATVTLEFLEEKKDLDMVICPVGGGGLLAGTALAAKAINHKIRIFGAEPLAVNDAWKSMKSGKIEPATGGETIADGLKTQLGKSNFPIIRKYVEEIILVEEKEIVESMRLVWERMKIIIEPSSAVALAAVFRESERFKGLKTGIILSGGNVDLTQLPFFTVV